MKNLLKSILLAGTTAGGAMADNVTVDAPIERVVVYRDGGAQITRSGRISLPAGRHTITIPKLSDDLDEDNRPVLALASSAAQVTSLKLESVYSDVPASERQQEIQARIKTAEQSQRGLQSSLEAKRMQLQFLRGLKGTPEGSDARPLSVDDWGAALTFVGEQAASLLAEIQALEENYQEGAQSLAALRRELIATGPAREDFQSAVVSLEGDALQNVPFTFSYFMDDAEWALVTNATLDTETKVLDITVGASVLQETGEDWQNVALSLSTTQPSEDLGYIELSPLILNLEDPAYRSRLERSFEPPQQMQASAPLAEDVEEVVVAGTKVRTRNTAFDLSYSLTRPSSIPSTGDPEYVTLEEAKAPAELIVRAAPTDKEAAILFTDVTLDGINNLQNVEVTLTRDGHYVGTGDWPNLIAGAPLQLPYGYDEGIDIDVVTLPPEDGDSGLFGSKRVVQERRLIRVTNNHSESRAVEIFDRTPVSGHEDIRVRTLRGATEPTARDMDGKEGLVMWRKTLAAGESWEITHAYSVTFPEDKQLVEN